MVSVDAVLRWSLTYCIGTVSSKLVPLTSVGQSLPSSTVSIRRAGQFFSPHIRDCIQYNYWHFLFFFDRFGIFLLGCYKDRAELPASASTEFPYHKRIAMLTFRSSTRSTLITKQTCESRILTRSRSGHVADTI